MVDVSKYNIYRITTQTVQDDLNEVIFSGGTIVHCQHDMGSAWLASRINTDDTPRMLPKSECRELTSRERKGLDIVNALV